MIRDSFELENGLAVRVLRQPPGVVAARNHAASLAVHEVLLFLDDDVSIEDVNFLERHRCNYEAPVIDAVCGQELSGPDFQAEAPDRSQFASIFEEAEFFNRRASERRLVAHLSTCDCSVRRSSFQKIGGFDPMFTGNSYGDDTDLAIRIVFDPLASVRHLHWREGGLQLNDRANQSSAFNRHLSPWLVYYRHARRLGGVGICGTASCAANYSCGGMHSAGINGRQSSVAFSGPARPPGAWSHEASA
jgi:hypothetical protein